MPLYKMSDKQYKAIRGAGKHIDVVTECNRRLCWPIVDQRQILLEHNNHTKYVCSVPTMRFITNVVTR